MFDWEENPEKGLRQWKKVPRAVCVCVCETTALIPLQSFSRHIRNVNLLLKKDFKGAGLLT